MMTLNKQHNTPNGMALPADKKRLRELDDAELVAQVSALIMETYERAGWTMDRIIGQYEACDRTINRVVAEVRLNYALLTAADLKVAFQRGWQAAPVFPDATRMIAWLKAYRNHRKQMMLSRKLAETSNPEQP